MAKSRTEYEHNTTDSIIDGKIDAASDQVKDFAGQAKRKYEEFSDKASETVEDISERFAEKYEDIKTKVKDQVNDAIDNAIDSSRKTGDKVKDYVADKPVQGLGIALVTGVVLGYLLTGLRSRKES